MNNHIRLFGYLGLLAALMVGIGEFLLHFNPVGVDPDVPFGYFLGIPQGRLTLGHYILVPFIPFYIFGYWHIYQALRTGSKTLAFAVLALGIFAFVIGGIWVGSRANLGVMVQSLHEAQTPDLEQKLIASYELHLENLVQILRIIILLLSVCFVWAILKGGTMYPKWMVFFNPVLLLLIVFALFFFVRPVGQYLAPTAMNVAHFGLFAASLTALRKIDTHPNKP